MNEEYSKLIQQVLEIGIQIFQDHEHFSQWKKAVFNKYDLYMFSLPELRQAVRYVKHIKRCLKACELARNILHRYYMMTAKETNFGSALEGINNQAKTKLSAIEPMCKLITLGCEDKTPYHRQDYNDRNKCDYALEKYVDTLTSRLSDGA